jgi:hypothetical protein
MAEALARRGSDEHRCLTTVDQAARLFSERPEAERLGGLIRACLEYRFT